MRKLAIVLTLVFILSLVVGAMGCGGGDGNWGEINGGQASERDGLRLIHKDALGGGYFDINYAISDRDLREVFTSFCREALEEEGLLDYGINETQVDYLAVQNEESGEGATIMFGRFDFTGLRSSLAGVGFTKGSYEGAEYWSGYTGPYGQEGVAIIADRIISGNEDAVKSVIRTMNGSEGSLYEVAVVREVYDRLPDWTPLSEMVTLDPMGDFGIPGAEAAATSATKRDRNYLNVAMVVKCVNTETARQLCESIEGRTDARARCEGKFVLYEGEMPVEDFL